MKVIIVCGQDFNDYGLLKHKCDYYLRHQRDVELVSGSVHGTHILVQNYVHENWHILFQQFFPEWEMFGGCTRYKLNEKMAEYSDMLIAFWNGKDEIGYMIDMARRMCLKVHIVRY